MTDPRIPLAPADRICQLRTAELFVLAAARLWVADYADAAAGPARWRDGFRAAGLGGGPEQAFDRLFACIAAGATRQIGFHCPTCACLGEDELVLLRIFADLQGGRHAPARRALLDWVAPGAARVAADLAADVARAMVQSGLWIPLRLHPAAVLAPKFSYYYQGSNSIH
jgi:hypothetical protein